MTRAKMSLERTKSLRALAKLMNKQNIRYVPVTNKLLECFDIAITPEENDFLLRMGTEPRTYEETATLSELSEKEFRPFFENQLRKGLIWPQDTEPGEKRYALSPIFVGWFEMYLCDGAETPEKQEFARCVEDYFQFFKKFNFFPLRNLENLKLRLKSKPLQTIAAIKEPHKPEASVQIQIDRSVAVPPTHVYTSGSVYELIERYGNQNQIAIVHCFCRQWHKMIDDPCRFDFPAESCMAIGDLTNHIVDYGIGRYITKDKAIEMLQNLEKKGAIHQVFHDKEDINRPEIAICNCCWDCCGVLGSYNRGILPLHFKSYYYAEKPDESLCTGCGTCEKYCPVNAISVDDGTSIINEQKCIGCGQCAFQCPEDAIRLVYKEREVFLPVQRLSKARINI